MSWSMRRGCVASRRRWQLSPKGFLSRDAITSKRRWIMNLEPPVQASQVGFALPLCGMWVPIQAHLRSGAGKLLSSMN